MDGQSVALGFVSNELLFVSSVQYIEVVDLLEGHLLGLIIVNQNLL